VPQTSTEPTFLPLTTSAARAAAQNHDDQNHDDQNHDGPRHDDPRARAAARVVLRCAAEADAAAADCWAALLADCNSPGRRLLASRLRALTEATASYAGAAWWHGEGSHLRRRVTEAQHHLVEAAREADGEDFAEAFVGYDQAIATTVVAVQTRLSSPA